MSGEVAVIEKDVLIHNLLVAGDTSRLNADQKTEYYMRTCKTLGLNPVTRPFEFIKLNGKEVLYAKKDATEQLRKINRVSVESMDGKTVADVYIVTVKVCDKDGRSDIATGAVNIKGLSGDSLANATMKAETKAKRRATLSICGLGILDESELETIPDIQQPKHDAIVEKPVAPRTESKPRGVIENALTAIRAAKTVEKIAACENRMKALAWTDGELLKLDDELAIAKQRIAEAV